MKPITPEDIEQLERIYQKSPSTPIAQAFYQFFRSIGQALKQTVVRGNEPRVSKFYDINGAVIWRVYDPVSEQSFVSRSEHELITWIEHHYLTR